jgi:phosphate transport system permease protein
MASGARPPNGLAGRLAYLRRIGGLFRLGTTVVAIAVLLFVAALAALLVDGSIPAFRQYGLGFLTAPALATVPVVVGTLLTSGLALLIALPVGVGVAIFVSEFAPRWVRAPLAYLIDLGSSIPSVVYGFWALAVLVPWMAGSVEPGLGALTGRSGPFSGYPLGKGLLTASLVLAIMIVPTIAALSREALRAVPRLQREAALGLGATRWEATRIAVLGPAAPGILAAAMLGLGRAVGETIAVALVIGNVYTLPTSLFSASATIPTLLVNQFGGATGLQQSALLEIGLVLFVMSVALNLGARLLVRRLERGGRRSPASSRRPRPVRLVPAPAPVGPVGVPAWWDRVLARRTAVLRRRRIVHAVVVALVVGAVAAAVVPLASLVATGIGEGGRAVATPSFYTSSTPAFCLRANASTPCALGGIGPAIEGTLILLGLASLAAVPIGLLTGIYLSEYGRHRFGRLVSLLVDVLVGVPSILIGVFVFALFLRYDRLDAQSALAGGAALALLMVPLISRATEVALRSVPASAREAALALGFPRHRVTTRIVLGQAKGALLTANLLALGRAGGETAALVLTAGTSSYWFAGLHAPIAALGPLIYDNLTVAVAPNWTEDAWGAALVLLLIMAALTLVARLAVREPSGVGVE